MPIEIKIGVGDFVRFLKNSGDLTADFVNNRDPEEGIKAHRYLQDQYSDNDEAEVYIKKTIEYGDFLVYISGYIDGLLNNGKIIEEIKSTTLKLEAITEDYHLQHNWQLMTYAYLYAELNHLDKIETRLTYITIDKYAVKSFAKIYDFNDLKLFFVSALEHFLSFKKILYQAEQRKFSSLKDQTFPFTKYRRGQRELMNYVYHTIKEHDILYAVAPTGIGKTMAVLFSSLKSLKLNTQKIFYLTAKSLGKQIAIQAMTLLKQRDLNVKTIEITSKEKICFQEERNCNPAICPYAKGYFERLDSAIRELFLEKDVWNQEVLSAKAKKFSICPFEFSLDISYYADVVIADYNYAFDPHAHLMRFFDTETYQPILLVDEAHNLVSRSKDMYSASINVKTIKELRRLLNKIRPTSRNVINKLLQHMETIITDESFSPKKELDNKLVILVRNVCKKLETIFSENITFTNRNKIFLIYCDLLSFQKIANFYDENFRFVIERNEQNVTYSINCLNASKFILRTIKRKAHGTVFFSATMVPLKYYMKLLTNDVGENLIISSPFASNHLRIIVKDDIDTRYTNRSQTIKPIIEVINALVSLKKGNYIVFFPSYSYLEMVQKEIIDSSYELIVQNREMTESERIDYIELFKHNDKSQIALFVMGGAFAEGIDYLGDMLSGVLVVTTCLPMICEKNNLLKEHYDETIGDGFDYAYTYPGFTKVVQAVGRVIRSENDRGIAILLDYRWNQRKYQNLMIKEWAHRKTINSLDEIKKDIVLFKMEEGIEQ